MRKENDVHNWIEQTGGPDAAAVMVAPAIRALFGNGRPAFVKYNESCSENADISIKTAGFSNLETVYQHLAGAAGHAVKPVRLIEIEGLGFFQISEPIAKRGSRLDGRVCLVTGAAQGFGEGIARELAKAGGVLVIADLNFELARNVAESICVDHGPESAVAVAVDVGDEASVQLLIESATRIFGGLDLIVSNAGVLRAGGLEEMTLRTFDFVTRINYTAFFLVTKYGSRPMKIQARFDPGYSSDIVQINSKSGLEGSNKNFAYAGGKFGGIGLVQSFAKELVEDRIKVNALCPGNYYEGPLWRDPEKGLFVQYLEAGKVPGAKTVQDVYDFYVAKVPMRRGCSPTDVTRAILYCVEQQYETGQAIPITGGQNMLK